MEVVAVHHQRSPKEAANQGILLDAILDDLAKRVPTTSRVGDDRAAIARIQTPAVVKKQPAFGADPQPEPEPEPEPEPKLAVKVSPVPAPSPVPKAANASMRRTATVPLPRASNGNSAAAEAN